MIKRNSLVLFTAIVLILGFASCSKKQENSVDLDLTKMSTEDIYAELFNMLIEPEAYKGKLIKAKGSFNVFESENKQYFAILIKDEDECCQEAIDFVWAGTHNYPDEYPSVGDEITITGRFTITELSGGVTYSYLLVDSLSL